MPPARGAPPLATQLPEGTLVCATVEEFIPGHCDGALYGASAVAIESVGRNLQHFEAACSRVVTLVAQAMEGVKGRYALLGGTASQADDGITFGPDGKALLRVLPARGDVSQSARLLGIPVEALAPGGRIGMVQRPVTGLPTPCATIQATVPNVFLILPLPAGRPASADRRAPQCATGHDAGPAPGDRAERTACPVADRHQPQTARARGSVEPRTLDLKP